MAKKGNSGDWRGIELVRGADMNGFCFGAVELKEIFAHPSLYVLQAGVHLRDKGEGSGGGDLKTQLSVIGIAMV